MVKADRKVTVMQITTHYNSGMQKSISEHTMKSVDRLQQQKTKKKSNKYLQSGLQQVKCMGIDLGCSVLC